jgi:hypothetical protein
MEPMDVTPKHDILDAWRPDETFCAGSVKDSFSIPNPTSQADVEFAQEHLFLNKSKEVSDHPEKFINDHNDWTGEEERDIECTISEFLDRTKEMEDQDPPSIAHCATKFWMQESNSPQKTCTLFSTLALKSKNLHLMN